MTLAQNAAEKNLLHAIYTEKNVFKKFEKTLNLGRYYQSKNIHKADSLKTVILQKSKHFDRSTRLNALLFSAEVNLLTGNLQEYKNNILEAESFLNSTPSTQNTFQLLIHLGNVYSNLLDFKKAEFFLRKAIIYAKRNRNYNQIAESDNLFALNFMRQNQKDSAMFYVNRAIQYARRSSKKEDLSYSFHTQALIFGHFGQVELSVAKNILALEFSRKINDIYQRSKLNLEIGKSQRMILNLDDAEYYFRLALTNAKKIEDYRQMGLALSNLGTVYYERKLFDDALNLTKRGINLLLKSNDVNGLGEAHNNLGLIYREKQDYITAALNFNRALVLFESLGNKEEIANVYHNVGTVFQKQKKYLNALNYLKRSVEIRQKVGFKNNNYPTYRVISEVYEVLGKEHEALQYIDLYLRSLDKNTSIQSARQIAELSELYRTEQRERLIESQAESIQREKQEKILTSTKLENSQLRNDFQFYIILAFILIIILATIILFYRWNQTKIKQQQREAEISQTLLRTQMNPHFVFNAMSVIQSYIYENDSVNSSKFLVNFSRLIRLILENSSKEFIPLETELDIIQKYLETQQIRFENRFHFQLTVSPEIDRENTFIPPMITQPFIENSVEHGQLHAIQNGMIKIAFQKVDNMLQIHIEDNGVGRKNASNNKSKEHKSMAINITKERIENLNKKYKTDGFLKIEDKNKKQHTGTSVIITLPFNENTKG
jgi:tetratricopeptide (TPR) repeat protein